MEKTTDCIKIVSVVAACPWLGRGGNGTEPTDAILVDERLGMRLCGGHCCGVWAGEGPEETAEDESYGGQLVSKRRE